MLYSKIEIAKTNALTPFDYIAHCLEKLSYNAVHVEKLLPWNVNCNLTRCGSSAAYTQPLIRREICILNLQKYWKQYRFNNPV